MPGDKPGQGAGTAGQQAGGMPALPATIPRCYSRFFAPNPFNHLKRRRFRSKNSARKQRDNSEKQRTYQRAPFAPPSWLTLVAKSASLCRIAPDRFKNEKRTI
jgi:hypothetical protein